MTLSRVSPSFSLNSVAWCSRLPSLVSVTVTGPAVTPSRSASKVYSPSEPPDTTTSTLLGAKWARTTGARIGGIVFATASQDRGEDRQRDRRANEVGSHSGHDDDRLQDSHP